jgi:hypothetical protein
MRAKETTMKKDMVKVNIALTADHREVLAGHGPYKLRPDGVIEDNEGVSLTNCRPNSVAEECEWDRALVALLNEIADTTADVRATLDRVVRESPQGVYSTRLRVVLAAATLVCAVMQ